MDQQLKATGYGVILGISGHNIIEQVQMVDRALKPGIADGTIAGAGMFEVVLGQSPDSNSDHAAKWETSYMMYFCPSLVDMAALGDGPPAPEMKPPEVIGGEWTGTQLSRWPEVLSLMRTEKPVPTGNPEYQWRTNYWPPANGAAHPPDCNALFHIAL